MAVAAVGMTAGAMVVVCLDEGGIGEVATAMRQYLLITGLQAMDVGLGGLGVVHVAFAAGGCGIRAYFLDHALMGRVLVVSAGLATMTGDAADVGVDVFFQKFVLDQDFLPYLQRRQAARSPLAGGFFRFHFLRLLCYFFQLFLIGVTGDAVIRRGRVRHGRARTCFV